MKVIYCNNDKSSDNWLTIGKEYTVLSLYSYIDGTIDYRLLADDGETPGLYKSNLFSIKDNSLPSNWEIKIKEGAYLMLAPKNWLDDSFWELFFDGEPEAVQIFDNEIKELLS